MAGKAGILFLDLDGVLAGHRVHAAFGRAGGRMRDLDPVGLAWINKLCAGHNLRIVITSVWRKDGADTFLYQSIDGRERDAMGYLKSQGIAAPFHDDWKTPIGGGNRGDDINAWIARNGRPQKILILDDDGDFAPWQKIFWAKTHWADGITWDTMQRAHAILESQDARKPRIRRSPS